MPTGLARTSKLCPAYCCSGYCRASIVTWATSSRGILRESVPVVSSSLPTTNNSRPGHWSSSRMDNGILDLFCSSGSLFHQVDLQFALPLDYHSTRCRSSMVIVGLPSQIIEGMLVQVRPAHGGTDHQHMRSRRAGTIDLILLSHPTRPLQDLHLERKDHGTSPVGIHLGRGNRFGQRTDAKGKEQPHIVMAVWTVPWTSLASFVTSATTRTESLGTPPDSNSACLDSSLLCQMPMGVAKFLRTRSQELPRKSDCPV